MEIMRSCAFTGPNLLRTPSNLYLPTKAKPILVVKKYQNSMVVKSLFFKKAPPEPTATAFSVILKPAQDVFKQIGVLIPDSGMRVAVYNTAVSTIGWVLLALGALVLSRIHQDQPHFKKGDLVEYKGEDCLVKQIGYSTIVLEGVHGRFGVENTSANRSLIRNISREAGIKELLSFQMTFDVKEQHKKICELIVKHMKAEPVLSGQKLHNFAITLPNYKIQVVGNMNLKKIDEPQYENFRKKKALIFAEISKIVEDNNPRPVCGMCQGNIVKAAEPTKPSTQAGGESNSG
ncbi:hypothetical protein MKW92_001901 [Papaver armeniacum]|nr:hypothetical protein MKW92_001901 [Papaver armeniacum]